MCSKIISYFGRCWTLNNKADTVSLADSQDLQSGSCLKGLNHLKVNPYYFAYIFRTKSTKRRSDLLPHLY